MDFQGKLYLIQAGVPATMVQNPTAFYHFMAPIKPSVAKIRISWYSSPQVSSPWRRPSIPRWRGVLILARGEQSPLRVRNRTIPRCRCTVSHIFHFISESTSFSEEDTVFVCQCSLNYVFACSRRQVFAYARMFLCKLLWFSFISVMVCYDCFLFKGHFQGVSEQRVIVRGWFKTK